MLDLVPKGVNRNRAATVTRGSTKMTLGSNDKVPRHLQKAKLLYQERKASLDGTVTFGIARDFLTYCLLHQPFVAYSLLSPTSSATRTQMSDTGY